MPSDSRTSLVRARGGTGPAGCCGCARRPTPWARSRPTSSSGATACGRTESTRSASSTRSSTNSSRWWSCSWECSAGSIPRWKARSCSGASSTASSWKTRRSSARASTRSGASIRSSWVGRDSVCSAWGCSWSGSSAGRRRSAWATSARRSGWSAGRGFDRSCGSGASSSGSRSSGRRRSSGLASSEWWVKFGSRSSAMVSTERAPSGSASRGWESSESASTFAVWSASARSGPGTIGSAPGGPSTVRARVELRPSGPGWSSEERGTRAESAGTCV